MHLDKLFIYLVIVAKVDLIGGICISPCLKQPTKCLSMPVVAGSKNRCRTILKQILVKCDLVCQILV